MKHEDLLSFGRKDKINTLQGISNNRLCISKPDLTEGANSKGNLAISRTLNESDDVKHKNNRIKHYISIFIYLTGG